FEGGRPGAFTVLGHDSRLGQVIDNLIDNARSFSPSGGTVRVTGRRLRTEVEVTIDDDGPGGPAEAPQKNFERFHTHRAHQDVGQNSGLGLSISKHIVEAHDGRIWTENRHAASAVPGETPEVLGARFVVRLPAMWDGASGGASLRRAPPRPARARRRPRGADPGPAGSGQAASGARAHPRRQSGPRPLPPPDR